MLQLTRLTKEQLLQKCKRMVREQKFKEQITDNPVNAVQYLQSDLFETFDHQNPEERKMVR